MLRLSKKSDYGLIALKHIASRKSGTVVNAREISREYNLPPDLLAKVLQQLAKSGILSSLYGSSGGYRLSRKPEHISVMDVVTAVDGPTDFLACRRGRRPCHLISHCTIRRKLSGVGKQLRSILGSLTVADL